MSVVDKFCILKSSNDVSVTSSPVTEVAVETTVSSSESDAIATVAVSESGVTTDSAELKESMVNTGTNEKALVALFAVALTAFVVMISSTKKKVR